MRLHFYKYQATGNDFVLFDNRKNNTNLTCSQIQQLCNRHYGIGSDGVIVLGQTAMADFKMTFYNPDGSTGMMCGNGGRAITMFAKDIHAVKNDVVSFACADKMYFARLTNSNLVELKMNNVAKIEIFDDGIWVDSGTSHFVTFVRDAKKVNVETKGRLLRKDTRFEKYNGANVDFVQVLDKENIILRTYERGVEAETLSCGTGVVASCLALSIKKRFADGTHKVTVNTLSDTLSVEYNKVENEFSSIKLIGPAEKVFEGDIDI